jgi:hypothetical protein
MTPGVSLFYVRINIGSRWHACLVTSCDYPTSLPENGFEPSSELTVSKIKKVLTEIQMYCDYQLV